MIKLPKLFNAHEHGVSPERVGYLFERFPSFTQTFCAREVAAMRGLGFRGPVFSIRDFRSSEPDQKFTGLGTTTYLPGSFEEDLTSDASFRREARKVQKDLCSLWGGEGEKHRIYEGIWLRSACREYGVAHIHTHFAGLSLRTAFWLRRLGGPTYSVTAHANDIFRDEPRERLAQTLGAAKCVVTVSDFSRHHLAREFPELEPKLHRVYNGIDMKRFQPSCFPEGRPLLLAVGRSIEKKGFPYLIEACASLRDLDFECTIIGGGPLDAILSARVDELRLGDKVHVAGPMTEAEIIALLARARAFVLPCIVADDGAMDNLPTVLMEAMAAALPVVSSPVAGVPEMIDHDKTGFLVPEKDVPALAKCLRDLIANKELARSLGRNGLEKCLDQFSIENTSRALAAVWEKHQVV